MVIILATFSFIWTGDVDLFLSPQSTLKTRCEVKISVGVVDHEK